MTSWEFVRRLENAFASQTILDIIPSSFKKEILTSFPDKDDEFEIVNEFDLPKMGKVEILVRLSKEGDSNRLEVTVAFFDPPKKLEIEFFNFNYPNEEEDQIMLNHWHEV